MNNATARVIAGSSNPAKQVRPSDPSAAIAGQADVSTALGGANVKALWLQRLLGLGAAAVMGPYQDYGSARLGRSLAEDARGKAFADATARLLAGEEVPRNELALIGPDRVQELVKLKQEKDAAVVKREKDAVALLKQTADLFGKNSPEFRSFAQGLFTRLGFGQSQVESMTKQLPGILPPLAQLEGAQKIKTGAEKELIGARGDVQAQTARMQGEIDKEIARIRSAEAVDVAKIQQATSKYGADQRTQQAMREITARYGADPERQVKLLRAVQIADLLTGGGQALDVAPAEALAKAMALVDLPKEDWEMLLQGREGDAGDVDAFLQEFGRKDPMFTRRPQP